MNPDFSQNEREQLEAKLTALLFGELSAEESAALRQAMEQDRELAALYEQLKLTIELVREGAAAPVVGTAAASAPLKLSAEKREKLLAQFKTIEPKEFARPRRVMDWLVPVAVTAAMIMILGALLLPALSASKSKSRSTLAKNSVVNNLRLLDGAKQQWALENNKPEEAEPTLDDLKPYLGRDGVTALPSVAGETYVPGKVSELPKVEASAKDAKKLFGPQALAGAETRDGKVLLSPLASMEAALRPERVANLPSVPEISYHASPEVRILYQKAPLQTMWGHAPVSTQAPVVPPAPKTRIVLPAGDGVAANRRDETLADNRSFSVSDVPGSLTTTNAVAPPSPRGGSTLAVEDEKIRQAQAKVDELRRSLGVSDAAANASSPASLMTADRLKELSSLRVQKEADYNQQLTLLEKLKSMDRGQLEKALPVAVSDPQLNQLLAERVQAQQNLSKLKLDFNGGNPKLQNAQAGVEDLNRKINDRVDGVLLGLESRTAGSRSYLETLSTDIENAAKTAPYFAAKEELDNAKRWRQILAMKAGQEEVDKDLPTMRTVSIVDPASVASAEKPSLGERLKETFSGKVERTARITVEQPRPDILVLGGPSVSQAYDPYFLLTEFETIQSHAVLGKVVSALKLNEEWGKKYNRGQPMNEADTEALLKKSLDLSTEKNTKVIDIGVKSEKPEDAARIANAVAEAYRQYRAVEYKEIRDQGMASLRTQLTEQDQKVAQAQTKVDELAKNLNALDPRTGMPIVAANSVPSHTRAFKVEPNTFYASLKTSEAAPTVDKPSPVLPGGTNRGLRYLTGLDPTAEIQTAVVQFFRAKGVDLTAPNSIFFNDRQGTLTVHATTADLDKVTAIMDAFNAQADTALPKPSVPPPTPQPEILVRDNAFSTFSLNVSDVSFKLAAASLEKGRMPEPASIRSEEFINAFDYRDPEAAPGVPIAFASERARYPFAHNRDLLRFSIKTAAAGRQVGRPLNIVLLLDNSGSMERADRVRIIQEALRVLAGQLQAADTFSIVTFARTARLRVDGVPGNQAAAAAREIAKLTPEGGTNLGEALDLAYQTARHHYLAKGDNRVVLLTDGAANLGEVKAETLKQKVEAQRRQGIALDGFGVGWEGYNDDLLEVLTRNGDGRYGFINSPEEASTEFVAQLAGALHVAAADVKVQVEFNPKRVTSYRQMGYAKHQLTQEQFRDNTVDAAEIAAQEAGNALYTIETNPQGEGSIATVRVRYKVPATGEVREQAWDVPYTGGAVALEQASAAMRLAATAGAFSEWLATSPFAAEVGTGQLLRYLSGVPQVYGADARPKKLEWMIRQAGSISGK